MKFIENKLDIMSDTIRDGMIECEYNNFDEYEYIDDNKYDECKRCPNIEYCYNLSVQKINHEYAESIDYGGCETEEEFWEDLFE